ncbi:MAG TPA: sugar-binding domain-containing protein [Ohtaekwangia sp.]|uniref:sugar-binding domain-containing protein n=1 Tax=Ohtaekwangia sp. TaxID=2066019 RepID=UPI002F927295
MYSCHQPNNKRVSGVLIDEWKFQLLDTIEASAASFDDSHWRILNLPHDWSIEGEFNEKNPAGVGGGALPGGTGWYRKSFALSSEDKDRNIFIRFDGVYRNSEIWINGTSLGKRPNGYISFEYDLTPYLDFTGKQNVLAVKLIIRSNQIHGGIPVRVYTAM